MYCFVDYDSLIVGFGSVHGKSAPGSAPAVENVADHAVPPQDALIARWHLDCRILAVESVDCMSYEIVGTAEDAGCKHPAVEAAALQAAIYRECYTAQIVQIEFGLILYFDFGSDLHSVGTCVHCTADCAPYYGLYHHLHD